MITVYLPFTIKRLLNGVHRGGYIVIVTDIRGKLLIFMQEKNIKQKDLAKELSFSSDHISAFMTGKYEISNRLFNSGCTLG
jgi:hypothetical protein